MKGNILCILLLIQINFVFGQMDRLVTLRNVNSGKGSLFVKKRALGFVSATGSVAPITGNQDIGIGSIITLSDATPGGVWSTSNGNLATVSQAGVVTGTGKGTPTISYTVTNAVGQVSTVSVVVNVDDVAPIIGNTGVGIGTTSKLTDATPGGAWTSSNNAIATVSSTGVVTGVANGTTTIKYTVTNAAGTVNNATTTVTVSTVAPITGNTNINVGSSTQLSNATKNGAYTWSSSNTAVATIDSKSGIVKGKTIGTTIITYSIGPNKVSTIVNVDTAQSASIQNSNNLVVQSTPSFSLPNVFSSNNSTINYVPSVNIIGGYSYVDTSTNIGTHPFLSSINANFFTSGISEFTSKEQVFASYLTPEASIWGLTINGTIGGSLKPSNGTQNLSTRIQVDFLGKKLATFDSLSGKSANNASCMSSHVKLGLEYMPFTDFLTLYINYDIIYSLTNVDTFQSYFKLTNTKALSFFDFGARLPITLASGQLASGTGSTSSTSFFVDVNFIPILADMKPYYSTNDKVIMSLKIGIIQNLGIKPKSLKPGS